ncbi:MAG TPA: Crp/Fnr family transcriptional regulator [Urbifossiella sp.]|jgi:CRP-like cAMP-binding protein|nr:Crp/Fnr family transcriptional regulator [Urbifossiella sp.]
MSDPLANLLLAALPGEDLARLTPHLERLTLASRYPVYDAGGPIPHVYFPVDCVISLVSEMDGGRLVEVATVGREGVVGLPVFWGAGSMPLRAFAQIPGDAYRMPADAFRAATAAGGDLPALLLRYTQAVFHQVARSAACNRVHPVDRRCARWLLMSHDRVGRDRFELTQVFLGQMLGVRRSGVGEAAGALQRAGLIRYTRGRITVVDRAGLEAAACECYRVIRDEHQRVAGGTGVPVDESST